MTVTNIAIGMVGHDDQHIYLLQGFYEVLFGCDGQIEHDL